MNPWQIITLVKTTCLDMLCYNMCEVVNNILWFDLAINYRCFSCQSNTIHVILYFSMTQKVIPIKK